MPVRWYLDNANGDTSCDTGGATQSFDLINSDAAADSTVTYSNSNTAFTREFEFDIGGLSSSTGTYTVSLSVNAASKADYRIGVELLTSGCSVSDSDTDTTVHTTTGTKSFTTKSMTWTGNDRVRVFVECRRSTGEHGNASITIDTDHASSYVDIPDSIVILGAANNGTSHTQTADAPQAKPDYFGKHDFINTYTRSGTGTQNFTAYAGFGTPTAAIIEIIQVEQSQEGTKAPGSAYMFGMWDGTTTLSHGVCIEDNLDTTNANSTQSAGSLRFYDSSLTLRLVATISSITDGIQLNFTTNTLTNPVRICVHLFGGDVTAHVEHVSASTSPTTVTPGFPPSVLIGTCSLFTSTGDQTIADAGLGIGFKARPANTDGEYSVNSTESDNVDVVDVYTYRQELRALVKNLISGATVVATSFESDNTVDLSTASGTAEPNILILGGIQNKYIASSSFDNFPTSIGKERYEVGFKPSVVLGISTPSQTLTSTGFNFHQGLSSSHGLGKTKNYTVNSVDAADTSDTISISSDRFIHVWDEAHDTPTRNVEGYIVKYDKTGFVIDWVDTESAAGSFITLVLGLDPIVADVHIQPKSASHAHTGETLDQAWPDGKYARVDDITITTTSTQDFTVSGFGTPDAAIVELHWITQAEEDTDVSHASYCRAFWDGTTLRCHGFGIRDGLDTTDTARYRGEGDIYFADPSTAEFPLLIAATVSNITDGIRLTYSTNGLSTGIRINVHLFGGGLDAKVEDFAAPGVIDTATSRSYDFVPRVGFFSSRMGGGSGDAIWTYARHSWGFWINDGADSQWCSGQRTDDGNGVASVFNLARNDSVVAYPAGSGLESWLEAAVQTDKTIDFTIRNNVQTYNVMGLVLGGVRYRDIIDTPVPTSTGQQGYNTTGGFQPEVLFNILTATPTINSATDSADWSFNMGSADAKYRKAYSHFSFDQDLADTTDSISRYNNTLIHTFDGSSASQNQALADLVSIDSTGFVLDWTSTPAARQNDVGATLVLRLVSIDNHHVQPTDATHAQTANKGAITTGAGDDHIQAVKETTHAQTADAPRLTQAQSIPVRESAHAQTADAPRLTQAQTIPVRESTHAQTADAPRLTQAHDVKVAEAIHAQTVDAPRLTQIHEQKVAEATHAQTADAPRLTQAQSIPVRESTHAQTADAPSLTQVHDVKVAEASHTQTVDVPRAPESHQVAIEESAHAQTADAPSLVQIHDQRIAESAHTQTADVPSLTQDYNVLISESSHAQTADAVGLSQVHDVKVAEAFHAQTADRGTVSESQFIPPKESAHAQTADAPRLTQVQTIPVRESAHAQTADAPRLTQVQTIPVRESAHAQTADAPRLTQVHDVKVAEAIHGQTADRGTVSESQFIPPREATHAQTADAPRLTQAQTIPVRESAHAQTADAVGLSQVHDVKVAEATHVQTSDRPSATESQFIPPRESTHAQTADAPRLTQAQTIPVRESAHAQTTDAPRLTQAQTIPVRESAHVQTADAVGLSQVHDVKVAEATHAQTSDRPSATESQFIPPREASHAQTADAVGLSQVHDVKVAEALHGQTADRSRLIVDYQTAIAEASHAHISDRGAITLQTVTQSIREAAHAQTADAPQLTQAQQISIRESAHAQTADRPKATEQDIIPPRFGVHVQTADAIGLSQVHDVKVTESTHAQTADAPPLSQIHDVRIDEAIHVQTADRPQASQAQILLVAESAHAQTADAPRLTQAQTIPVRESAHAQTADAPRLTQAQTIPVRESAHAQTADAVGLTQVHDVRTSEATHAQTADRPQATQSQFLSPSQGTHAQTADAPRLTQAQTIPVRESTHAQTADAPRLTQAQQIPVRESTHEQAVDVPEIVQDHLAPARESLHAHTADRAAIGVDVRLSGKASTHAQTADAVAISQVHDLKSSEAGHPQTADRGHLSQVQGISVRESDHAQTADAPRALRTVSLATRPTDHAQTADAPEITQDQTPGAAEANHTQTADRGALTITDRLVRVAEASHAVVDYRVNIVKQFVAPPSTDRTWTVPIEVRTFSIGAEDRKITITSENRLFNTSDFGV